MLSGVPDPRSHRSQQHIILADSNSKTRSPALSQQVAVEMQCLAFTRNARGKGRGTQDACREGKALMARRLNAKPCPIALSHVVHGEFLLVFPPPHPPPSKSKKQKHTHTHTRGTLNKRHGHTHAVRSDARALRTPQDSPIRDLVAVQNLSRGTKTKHSPWSKSRWPMLI